MQRSKLNELSKEVDKTSALRGGAVSLNAIRLAVREEIREALIQGGFSFADRLLDTEEASKVLQVSPDWLYRNSRKLPFTRRTGAESPTLFLSRDPDVDSERCRRLVLEGPYLECGPAFPENQECVLHLSAQAPCNKRFPVLFSEVDVDRRLSRNHSTTPIPYTQVVLLTSGGVRAALLCSSSVGFNSAGWKFTLNS